jgi:two-component system phosphate regulon sensor histidine kinase PhoR
MADLRKALLSVLLPALLRVGLLALIGIVIGIVFGVVPAVAVVIAGLVILLAIHMTYATRLADWLETPVLDRIPNGWGLWADVFARLYRQRRGTEINERRLLENEERFRRTIMHCPKVSCWSMPHCRSIGAIRSPSSIWRAASADRGCA